MNLRCTIGIVLLILGVILFTTGMNATDSLADRWSDFFTGHYTDSTVWQILGGLAIGITGLSMSISCRKRGKA